MRDRTSSSQSQPCGAEVEPQLLAQRLLVQVRSADRFHAPDMERAAENQRPKTRDHRDPKLYRYDGTDLYQWFSKVGGPFEDPCGEPFVIASPARPEAEPSAAELVAALRAPSFRQDSRWHVPPFDYATKPRALLEAAAAALEALSAPETTA